MAIFSKFIATKKGEELTAQILSGEITELNFQKLALSSKDYTLAQIYSLESLENIKQESLISDKEIVDDTNIKIIASCDNSELKEDYTLKTVGLYINDILFGACIETTGKEIINKFEDYVNQILFNLIINIGSTTNISININPSANATKEYVDKAITEVKECLTQVDDGTTTTAYTKVYVRASGSTQSLNAGECLETY